MTELDQLIEAEADKCCFDWFDNTLPPPRLEARPLVCFARLDTRGAVHRPKVADVTALSVTFAGFCPPLPIRTMALNPFAYY